MANDDIKEIIDTIGFDTIEKRTSQEREEIAKLFIDRRIINALKMQEAWGNFTHQTNQIKGSRLAEHLVSIVSGIPGRGSTATGGGPDLNNGEEIKSGNRIAQKGEMTDSHVIISFGGDEDFFEKFLEQKKLWFVFFDIINGKVRVQIWTIDPSSKEAQIEFRDWKSVDSNWEYGKINLRIYQDGTTYPLHPRFARMNPRLIFKAIENDEEEAEILIFNLDGGTPPDLPNLSQSTLQI